MPRQRETQSAPAEDHAPSPATPPDPQPAAVLVVDDDPRAVEVVTFILEAEGFRLLAAEDGEAALAVVAHSSPDVVLLDVRMPGLDGFEVCRRLKADPATVFVPVVLLTSLTSTHDRIAGAAAGADDFLSKPFDNVELATRVKSLVRVKRLHDQIQDYNRELEARVAERTAELQRALEQLRELDQLKSEFIANVSHELRTPLLHVKGYLDLLVDGVMGDLSPEQRQGIGVAQEAVRQLERIVQDVVDFRDASQRVLSTDSGRGLNLEPVSIAEAARAALEIIAPFATRRSIQVSLNFPPNLPLVRGDRAALTRILRHLLDNAVKFSPPGEGVLVTGEARPFDRLKAGPGFVRVAVLDHGAGIPPEKLDHIFDIFYQADGSTTRRAGGLGVGLALVKVLLDAHAAQIRVQSEVGRGTTFYFDLSVADR